MLDIMPLYFYMKLALLLQEFANTMVLYIAIRGINPSELKEWLKEG